MIGDLLWNLARLIAWSLRRWPPPPLPPRIPYSETHQPYERYRILRRSLRYDLLHDLFRNLRRRQHPSVIFDDRPMTDRDLLRSLGLKPDPWYSPDDPSP
jgi:hypothetical protein